MIQVVSQFLQLRFADGTTVVEAGHQAGQGIAVQPCQKGLALLGLIGLGREGWGVEIGAGASVAADEALFSQAGQGGHQGGQGPGSTVPQLLENLAGGQRGLGGEDFAGLFPSMVEGLSLFERFYQFVDGVFDLTSLVYFLTVIGVFLFLTVQSLEKRRWSE